MANNKNVFLNWISEKMIHINATGEGRQFASISFPCKDSATGYASVGVNMGQLLPATKKDKTVAEGYNLTAADKDNLRKYDIVFTDMMED